MKPCCTTYMIKQSYIYTHTTMLVLVFDTETNGLPKNMKSIPNGDNFNDWPNIVQLSYILYDTDAKRVIAIHDHIIRVPVGFNITEESIKFHGITNEISQKNGTPFDQVINTFMENVRLADLVVAHNVEFDQKIIVAELFRIMQTSAEHGVRAALTDIARAEYYCTMQQGVNLCNIKAFTKTDKKEYIKFPTLLELCKHLFQYEPKNLHNSLNDVLVCFQCFYEMRFNIDICKENIVIQSLIDTLV